MSFEDRGAHEPLLVLQVLHLLVSRFAFALRHLLLLLMQHVPGRRMLARQPTARGVGLLADLLLQLLLLAVLFLRFGGCNLALLQCDAGQRTLKLDLPLLRDRVR